jgi:hypothetical protein
LYVPKILHVLCGKVEGKGESQRRKPWEEQQGGTEGGREGESGLLT